MNQHGAAQHGPPALELAAVSHAGTVRTENEDFCAAHLDDGGIAVEDLTAGDLFGTGRIDIVAVGRATHNVRIYRNAGK